MRVEFASRRLRERFESYVEGSRAWGEPVAGKYVQRVTLLHAAARFADLQTFSYLRLHTLKGERAGSWPMVLHGRWRLIIRPMADLEGVLVEEVTNHYDD